MYDVKKRSILQDYSAWTFFIVSLTTINLIGYHNRSLFHFIAELITIIIGCCLFAIIWVTREKLNNGFFSIIGIGLLFASFLDIFHTITFENTGLLPGLNLNQSLYFWLAARFLQSLTFLVAPFYIEKRSSYPLVIGINFALTAGCIALILYSDLPLLITAEGNISITIRFASLAPMKLKPYSQKATRT